MISMQEGDVAPDFELQANDGSVTKLGYFKGKKTQSCVFTLKTIYLHALQKRSSKWLKL